MLSVTTRIQNRAATPEELVLDTAADFTPADLEHGIRVKAAAAMSSAFKLTRPFVTVAVRALWQGHPPGGGLCFPMDPEDLGCISLAGIQIDDRELLKAPSPDLTQYVFAPTSLGGGLSWPTAHRQILLEFEVRPSLLDAIDKKVVQSGGRIDGAPPERIVVGFTTHLRGVELL